MTLGTCSLLLCIRVTRLNAVTNPLWLNRGCRVTQCHGSPATKSCVSPACPGVTPAAVPRCPSPACGSAWLPPPWPLPRAVAPCWTQVSVHFVTKWCHGPRSMTTAWRQHLPSQSARGRLGSDVNCPSNSRRGAAQSENSCGRPWANGRRRMRTAAGGRSPQAPFDKMAAALAMAAAAALSAPSAWARPRPGRRLRSEQRRRSHDRRAREVRPGWAAPRRPRGVGRGRARHGAALAGRAGGGMAAGRAARRSARAAGLGPARRAGKTAPCGGEAPGPAPAPRARAAGKIRRAPARLTPGTGSGRGAGTERQQPRNARKVRLAEAPC